MIPKIKNDITIELCRCFFVALFTKIIPVLGLKSLKRRFFINL